MKHLKRLFLGCIFVGIMWFFLLSCWYATLTLAKLIFPYIGLYYPSLGMAVAAVGYLAYLIGRSLDN